MEKLRAQTNTPLPNELRWDESHNIMNVRKIDDNITWEALRESVASAGGVLIGPFQGDRLHKEECGI